MIRIAVMYPNSPDATFDHAYYAEKHIPMVAERGKSFGMVRGEIDKGLAGGAPDAPMPFLSIGYLVFDSLEGFQRMVGAHGQEIMGDIPNYTNTTPVIQISEVV